MRKRIGTEGIEPSLRIKAIALPTELRSKKRGATSFRLLPGGVQRKPPAVCLWLPLYCITTSPTKPTFLFYAVIFQIGITYMQSWIVWTVAVSNLCGDPVPRHPLYVEHPEHIPCLTVFNGSYPVFHGLTSCLLVIQDLLPAIM